MWTVYRTNSELTSSISSLDVEQYLAPPPLDTWLLGLAAAGEFGLLEREWRGTGLVKPMLLLRAPSPAPFPPEETIMVTGEAGDEALRAISFGNPPLSSFLLPCVPQESSKITKSQWEKNLTEG